MHEEFSPSYLPEVRFASPIEATKNLRGPPSLFRTTHGMTFLCPRPVGAHENSQAKRAVSPKQCNPTHLRSQPAMPAGGLPCVAGTNFIGRAFHNNEPYAQTRFQAIPAKLRNKNGT
mmetsp:Transcript_4756/g.30096  ORF Transcript_4756/g.30096 Transcript_4756/m.30096 type:complete len:117 (+) Transcript_4756:2280-2630(+)